MEEIGTEKSRLRSVIAASSAGTLIEWYDFYIFGSLAVVISNQFFPKDNSAAALLSTLAIFATGFIVRPFGALVFGRIGDLVGRKHAFLVTLLMMGFSTFAIGLVPNYSQIGVAAPLIVLLLRLAQGLALGGEYGGAATYVAEHAPDNRRGYYTSFIQTTATLGLLVSILVIITCQSAMPKEAFEDHGWRIPFLLSSVLVVFSYFIRIKLQESPLFQEMKSQGKQSTSPWKDSFGNKENLKVVLIALFGATMGQGVVWYTGQFYALYFLQTEMKLDKIQANTIVAIALVLATPLFIVFGGLSDRIGRKKIMLTGFLLAGLGTYSIFGLMLDQSKFEGKNVATETFISTGKPTAAKEAIAKAGIKKGDIVTESKFAITYDDGTSAVKSVKSIQEPGSSAPPHESVDTIDKKVGQNSTIILTACVFVLVSFVTMVYGPIAAFLVELFPTKIRYSSMSLPYHIGNGVFGGLVPFIGTAVVTSTHMPLSGLYYPIAIAFVSLVIGTIFLPDKRGISLKD